MFPPAFQRQPRAKDRSQFLRTVACSLRYHSRSCLAPIDHQPNVHTHTYRYHWLPKVTYMIGQTTNVYVYIGAKFQFSVRQTPTTPLRHSPTGSPTSHVTVNVVGGGSLPLPYPAAMLRIVGALGPVMAQRSLICSNYAFKNVQCRNGHN